MAIVGDGHRRRYERVRTVIARQLSCSDFRVDVAFRHSRLGRVPPVVLSSAPLPMPPLAAKPTSREPQLHCELICKKSNCESVLSAHGPQLSH